MHPECFSKDTAITPASNTAGCKGRDWASEQAYPWIVAVCALLSLNPYWFWHTSWHLVVAAAITFLVAVALASKYRPWPRGAELTGVVLLTAFVFYITALPKVGGGHIRWVFVCPTLWALALMPSQLRVRTLKIFAGLFALSVVPATLLSLYLVTGLPITLETMPYGNHLMAAGGTQYVMLPGALILESNSVITIWGGMLGRIAGVYDEPNTVGTIAGLVIAGLRCNLRDWRVIIALIAGVLSFSLAFMILTSLILLLTAIVLRSRSQVLAAIPALLSGAVLVGSAHFAAAPGTSTNIVVKQAEVIEQSESVKSEEKSEPLEEGVEYTARESGLRPHELDSRSNPSMDALIDQFWASDWKLKAVGLGSDASLVYGSVASAAHRLYTDYGLIGLVLFGLSFGALGLGLWRRSRYSPTVMLFLTMFALSIYQRPIVWMPYTLLLLFGAASNAGDSRDSPAQARSDMVS